MGDPELEAKLYSAVTGRPPERLDGSAETIADLQRAILIREGRKPEADRLPEYNFIEGLSGSGMHGTLVPGEGDRVVDMSGHKLDKDRYEEMLREYYRLRDWDESTGMPRAGMVEKEGRDEARG